MITKLVTIFMLNIFILSFNTNNILAQENKGLDHPPYHGVKRLDAKFVKHLVMTERVLLIDVPSNRPYEQYHICGAIDATKFGDPNLFNIQKIPKDFWLIIYCD
jgi:hypothetical protein